LADTSEHPAAYGGETGLTSLAAKHFLPTDDFRREIREKPITALDGYERVTPPQSVKIEPGYYVRLVIKLAVIAVVLLAAGYVLYLLSGFVF